MRGKVIDVAWENEGMRRTHRMSQCVNGAEVSSVSGRQQNKIVSVRANQDIINPHHQCMQDKYVIERIPVQVASESLLSAEYTRDT